MALDLVTKQAQLGRLGTDLTGRRYQERHRPEALDLYLVPAQGQEDEMLDGGCGRGFQCEPEDQALGLLFAQCQGQLLHLDGLPP